jgi:hypothetical protein
MSKPARATSEIETANGPDAFAAAAENATRPDQVRPRSTLEKRLSPRPKASRSSPKHSDAQRDVSSTKSSQSRSEGQASTLLVGAGIGAALTLSIVALRAKERPPTFALFRGQKASLASALVKTAVYAIARASKRGSVTNLLARAVGSSLA